MKEDSPTLTMTGASTEDTRPGGLLHDPAGPSSAGALARPQAAARRGDGALRHLRGVRARRPRPHPPGAGSAPRPPGRHQGAAHPGARPAPRFMREALVTARLQHPAIVPVYEAGRWPAGEPFYAMKLVSGRSLAERHRRRARRSSERLALLPHVIAVAEAMAYAHSRAHHPPRPQARQRAGGRLRRDGGHRLGPRQGLWREEPRGRAATRRRRPADGELDLTPARCWARPRTCRPSRPRARPSTSAPTSTRWAPSSTTCSPARRPTTGRTSADVLEQVVRGPPPPLARAPDGHARGPADHRGQGDGARSRRSATPPRASSPTTCAASRPGRSSARTPTRCASALRRFLRRYRAAVRCRRGVAGCCSSGHREPRPLLPSETAPSKQREAEAAQKDAERARQQEQMRADELTLMHARTGVDRDPTRSSPGCAACRPASPAGRRCAPSPRMPRRTASPSSSGDTRRRWMTCPSRATAATSSPSATTPRCASGTSARRGPRSSPGIPMKCGASTSPRTAAAGHGGQGPDRAPLEPGDRGDASRIGASQGRWTASSSPRTTSSSSSPTAAMTWCASSAWPTARWTGRSPRGWAASASWPTRRMGAPARPSRSVARRRSGICRRAPRRGWSTAGR